MSFILRRRLYVLDHVALYLNAPLFIATIFLGIAVPVLTCNLILTLQGTPPDPKSWMTTIFLVVGIVIAVPGVKRWRMRVRLYQYGALVLGRRTHTKKYWMNFGEDANTTIVTYSFELDGETYDSTTFSDASVEDPVATIVLYLESDPKQCLPMLAFPKYMWDDLYEEASNEGLPFVKANRRGRHR